MDRATAAARATRAAESKGHTLGEVMPQADEAGGGEDRECLRCWMWAIVAHSERESDFTWGGNATLYPCHPSGKRGTLTHTNEAEDD